MSSSDVYYILENYELTQVYHEPNKGEYEVESILDIDGRREITYKRIDSDEDDVDEDEEEEEKGDWCYGTTVSLSKTYIMAGGSCHWWNYVVEFDVDTGEQKSVYIESKYSKEKQDGYYLFVDEDGNRLALELECPGEGWTILDHPLN